MTAKVLTSELGVISREDFALCVQKHADDLRTHDAHMAEIAAGDKDRVPYPPPSSLELVDRCVRRPDLVADFEVVDDTPPGPTEEERLQTARAARRGEVARLEAAAEATIIPPGKVRAHNIRVADALHVPEGKRSKADVAFLREHEAVGKRIDAIHRHGAKLEAVIEDMDEEALKTWQPEPFPS